jgi:hypothetical protein
VTTQTASLLSLTLGLRCADGPLWGALWAKK